MIETKNWICNIHLKWHILCYIKILNTPPSAHVSWCSVYLYHQPTIPSDVTKERQQWRQNLFSSSLLIFSWLRKTNLYPLAIVIELSLQMLKSTLWYTLKFMIHVKINYSFCCLCFGFLIKNVGVIWIPCWTIFRKISMQLHFFSLTSVVAVTSRRLNKKLVTWEI